MNGRRGAFAPRSGWKQGASADHEQVIPVAWRVWDLSQRQDPCARFVRPIESNNGALVQFHFAILKGTEKCRTANFWYKRLTTKQHNTRSATPGVREDLGEIQIVSYKHETTLARVLADFGIFGCCRAD